MDLVGDQFIEDGSHTPYYSPAFPREGLAATFVADVTHKKGPGAFTLSLSIEHRDLKGAWSTVGSFSSITSTGIATRDFSGIKQLVRWVATPSGGSAKDFYRAVLGSAWRQW